MSAQTCRMLRLALTTAAVSVAYPSLAAEPCNAYAYPCADTVMSATPARTTATVRQEAQDARLGMQPNEGDSRFGRTSTRSTTTRAAVNAELLSAQRAHQHSGYRGHAEPLDAVYVN